MKFAELKIKLADYDLGKIPTLLIMAGIISAYIFVSYNELYYDDCYDYGILETGLCGDHAIREFKLAEWNYDFFLHFRHAVTLSILALARDFLGEPRYITFASSIALVIISYFFGKDVAKSRIAGVITSLFVVTNPIFFRYDTGITYPTFWTSFYILSVWLIIKPAWFVSVLGFLGSVVTKIMGVLYFPATILFIWFADIPARRKQFLIMSYAIAGGIIATVFFAYLPFSDAQFDVNLNDFVWWLGMWSIELANSRITLVFLMVCFFGLFLLRQQKVPNATAILAVLIVAILQPSIVAGFTTFTNEEYRFLPLVVFIGAGLGLIITNMDKIKLKMLKKTVS